MAETVRSSAYYKKLKPSPVTPISIKPELSVQPIVFEQVVYFQEEGTVFSDLTSDTNEECAKRIVRCASIKAANKDYEGVHLFVLCHGLLGNAYPTINYIITSISFDYIHMGYEDVSQSDSKISSRVRVSYYH